MFKVTKPSFLYCAVLGIRIRRIRMFLGLPDPDPYPLVRGTDPDPDPLVRSTDPDPADPELGPDPDPLAEVRIRGSESAPK